MKNKIKLLLVFCFMSVQIFAQFTLDAELRPRTEMRNGYKSLKPDNTDPAFFISQRTRMNVKYATEKYVFYVSGQDIRVWGDVKQLNTSDKNGFSLHQAWALVKFNGMALKAGRQEIVYDDQRMFGSVGWAQQGRSHDALLFQFGENFKLDLGFAFNQDKENLLGTLYTTPGSYKAFQYAWFNKKWESVAASFLLLNNGLQYIDAGNSDNNDTRFSQTLGTHLKFKFSDAVNANVNLYYQTGNDVLKKDISAFLVGADLGFKTGDTWNLGLGFEMQSGNDFDGDVSKNKAFSPFYGTNHKFNGFMDYFYVGNHFNSTGLIDVYAKATAKFNQNSNLAIFLHNFTSYAEVAADTKRQLGTELDLVYNRKFSKDVSLGIGYSHMFASEGLEVLKNNFDGNTNNWAWVMLTVKPTLFSK